MGPICQKSLSEREAEIQEEYLKTLQDLTFNSKPLIDVLTEVADENREYASCIVRCIEEQLEKVSTPLKLPILYLIDSIIKCETIKQYYLPLFCKNIHKSFTKVYELGDDNVRNKLSKLRFTWNGVLPAETLIALDNMVRALNPSWQATPPHSVHVNPKFIPAGVNAAKLTNLKAAATKEELRQKQKELMELTQRKQELEQELKILRPMKIKPGECKTTEKLMKIANQLFAQVEQVKIGTFNPLEVQRVRESASIIKNSVQKLIDGVPTDSRYATLGKNSAFLVELFSRITETEKVLAELEKLNQCKRKVILVNEDKLSSNQTDSEIGLSTSQITKPDSSTKNCIKISSSANQYSHVSKTNGSLAVQMPNSQNPPAFRIAPVSSQLINAAVRRARDPRLQKLTNVPGAEKSSNNPDTVMNGNRDPVESTLRTLESKSVKRNESPEELPVAETVSSKKAELSRVKHSSTKNSSSARCSSVKEKTSSPRITAGKTIDDEEMCEIDINKKNETLNSRKRKSGTDNDEKRKKESPSPEKRKFREVNSIKRKSENCKKSRLSVSSSSSVIDELFDDKPKKDESRDVNAGKVFSKEERNKRLRILMHAQETEQLLESLSKKSPRMAEKFIRLMKKEKETLRKSPVVDVDADSDMETNIKPPVTEVVPKSVLESEIEAEPEPEPKLEPEPQPQLEPEPMDICDVDCEIVSSPKPAEISEKVSNPPKLEFTVEPESFEEKPSQEESVEFKTETKNDCEVEPYTTQTSPPHDVDLRSLIASAPVMLPPACTSVIVPSTSAPVTASSASCKSPPAPAPPIFPFMMPSMEYGFTNPANFGLLPTTVPEVPQANEDVLEMIERDPMTTINIDAVPREIRHYGSTAVVFINWDDPRQILFSSHDGPRKIVVDNKFFIPCSLNASDVESLIYGKPHRFRLGAPTRELYIDGIGYECYFGGAPIKVRFDGRYHSVRLEGKPPKVDIGKKRSDLVAGKVSMVINDKHTFSVFLDAKPQKIEVDGNRFVIMLIDSLQRVLINDVPFRTDFGGMPQSFKYYNKVYYFRFSMLPIGIVPGAVNLYQMITSKLPSPPPLPPSLRYSTNEDFPVLPLPSVLSNVPTIPVNALPVMMNQTELSSLPPVSENSSIPINVTTSETTPEREGLSESLSIDELVQKLLKEGLVTLPNSTSTTTTGSKSVSSSSSSTVTTSMLRTETASVEDKAVRYVDFEKPETLKQKQPRMISTLYTGNQCGSCGLRFPEEQTLKYSEHLDWHFRLNRKGRDGARTVHSRKWYYNATNWMQFQEMEDKSDRGQIWFDNHLTTEYTEEVIEEVPCVTASPDTQESCELCRDRFEQFYNEEIEEWQLRNAIKIDDKHYHPICYQDRKDQGDHSDDVEEIVDMTEPIDVDDPSIIEADSSTMEGIEEQRIVNENTFEKITIKQEKPESLETSHLGDIVKDSEQSELTRENENDTMEDNNDSDVEEVQLIEEPIEEIIIPDDGNDLEEHNLETLNVEDILAAQQEIEDDSVVTNLADDVPVEKIVDITHSVSTVMIDGNVELGDSVPSVMSGPTKIKINIVKNHTEDKNSNAEDKVASPQKDQDEKEDLNNSTELDKQPPPPGEEMEEMITLVPADVKCRIRDRKLVEYPPVKKGVGDSGLCSIM